MKTTLTRALAIILIVSAIMSSFPVFAFAGSSSSIIEVKVENAPIRSKPSEKGKIVLRCHKGELLKCTGSLKNDVGNQWFKITIENKTLYIFSGNVKKHSHKYKVEVYLGVKYKICEACGNIVVEQSKTIKTSEAKRMAGSAILLGPASYSSNYGIASAGAIAASDGPLPFGDAVAIGFVILLAYYTIVKAPSDSVAKTIVTTLDLDKFIEKKEDKNVCNYDEFRLVSRDSATLTCTSKKCLDQFEAYIYVRYKGRDVWSRSGQAAYDLANFYVSNVIVEGKKASCYPERDGKNPSHFYHYHIKINDKKQAVHIFFGANSYGQIPKGA